MFNTLIELYTKGNITNLQNMLLHSSSWQQHGFTAYGETQIKNLWLNSLNDFGFGDINHKITVDDGKFATIYCLFATEDNQEPVRLIINFEHNNSHIKRVKCTIDSISYLNSLESNEQHFMANLPTADPIIISQFDHQQHPHTFHAQPSDIAELQENQQLINTWWQLWQCQQFPNIDDIYADDAQINLPSANASNKKQDLRNFILGLSHQLNRSYCQLERIVIDQQNCNNMSISWQIDADIEQNNNKVRVRLPVQTMLIIDQGKITKEEICIDWHAAMKQFNLSSIAV